MPFVHPDVLASHDATHFRWRCPGCGALNLNRVTCCEYCQRQLTTDEMAEFARLSMQPLRRRIPPDQTRQVIGIDERVSVAPNGLSFRWLCPQCDCWNPNRRVKCIDCDYELTIQEMTAFAQASIATSRRREGIVIIPYKTRRKLYIMLTLLIVVCVGYFVVIPCLVAGRR